MKKIVLLMVAVLFVGGLYGQSLDLNVATYNLRMDTPRDGENSWTHRKEMVKGLVRFHDFDLFGTQEGFIHQIKDLLETGVYDYVGAGRDDGKDAGEHSAIFYKKDRFTVLDKGNYWLSETPDVPGKGWDATCCNRICSWAKFREKATGKEFYFFNVHYDHEGREARRQSSHLMLARIKAIAGDAPVFCTGDFNATPDDEPIRLIYADGLFTDSYELTQQPPYGPVGTYQAFQLNSPLKERIDYIFVTKEIRVNKYGVLTDMDHGRFPSDHCPVMVTVSF
ncbi:MAG: endonuclease/exonuclease/phosphatase family protein [Tannerellaceae bacterium]|jgi:endonuclease/exonuclease/phosphatase family metal-dependent hydrolase|nr:endonuclease/exonuclease/phosphatase family protein [Tannerellaceae bacterium]